MGFDSQLTDALRDSARPVTVKQLKKHKVGTVRVIERSAFLQLINDCTSTEKKDDALKRRMERLLQEVEKLSRDKKGLEHTKAIAETERTKLQVELDSIANEIGKRTGKKVSAADVKVLVETHAALRAENKKTRAALARMQAQAQQRLDEALGKSQSLKQNLDRRTEEHAKAERERDEVQLERDTLAQEKGTFVSELDQFKVERDRFREERDRFRMERDRFREERDLVRQERDGFLQDCAKVGQERDLLRERLDELAELRRRVVQMEDIAEGLNAQKLDLEDEVVRQAKEIDELQAEVDEAETQLAQVLLELQTKDEEEDEAEAEAEVVPERLPTPQPASKRLKAGFEFGFGGSRRRGRG
jgi:chromosome segregation ATPase